jgi:single-strand DNA-binding protein
MDVNKVILIGNLTNEPTAKKLKSGKDVAYVGLATNLIWKRAGSDQTQTKVEFHNLVFWGKIVQVVEKYLSKGDKVYVEGRLQTKTWEDDKKIKHYKTEVIVKDMVMLGGKKKEDTDKATAVEEIQIEEE